MEQEIIFWHSELLGPIDDFELDDEGETEIAGVVTPTFDVMVHYVPTEERGGVDCIVSCTSRRDAEDILNLLQSVVNNYQKS